MRLRRCVACHFGMICEKRDEMFVSCGNRPIPPARVLGGKTAPKFDCHYFDPTCAAGGSVSQGPEGAQRREATTLLQSAESLVLEAT